MSRVMKQVTFDEVVPLKAIPDNLLKPFLDTTFKIWVSELVDLKSDKEGVLNEAVEAIKTQCWDMSPKDIQKMLRLYVDGRLGLDAFSNHFDRILVNKIVVAFQGDGKIKKTFLDHPTLEMTDEEKNNLGYLCAVTGFDDYKSSGLLSDSYWTTYDYLVEKKIIEFTEKERIEAFNIVSQDFPDHTKIKRVKISKRNLLKRFYDQLITKKQHIKDLL